MRRLKMFLSVSVAVLALSSPALADDHGKPAHEAAHQKAPHHAAWGYGGQAGPQSWGQLDSAYKACAEGMKQSPINIAQFAAQEMPALKAAYGKSPLHVVNNGHTVQVDYAPGSTLTSAGKTYALKQIHFHTPSEHYIDGAPYPMEAHFVHMAEDGELAVIGVMMKVGAANEAIQTIWAHIPAAGQASVAEETMISAVDLLPRTGIYFKYEGSLTTPPCSEGVHWHVMQDPITISAEQLNAFQALFPLNARPIQPLNGRVVSGG